MKLPDKDEATICYCFLALGMLASFCIANFTNVRLFPLVCLMAPVSLCLAFITLRFLDRSIGESIRRYNVPVRVTEIENGEIRQYAERWEICLGDSNAITGGEQLTITGYAPTTGPTNAQLELARAFSEKYIQAEPEIRNSLGEYLTEVGMPADSDIIDFGNMSVDLCAPNLSTDLEITYESLPHDDDMGYTVTLNNWSVCDVYSGD